MRTVTPEKKGPFLFGDSSWAYDTCMSCGWKEGLGWGEEVSEKGSVKQTKDIHTAALYAILKIYSHGSQP